MLNKLWLRLLWGSILALIRQALNEVINEVLRLEPTKLQEAKEKVKAKIQSKKKVPGTLRKWACWEVDDVSAKDIADLIRKLEALALVMILMLVAVPAWAQVTPAPEITVAIAPNRINVGATGQVTIAVTNTSTKLLIDQATSTATVTYVDTDVLRTTTSAPCIVYVQRAVPGADWNQVSFVPTIPGPLVPDWSTVAFTGNAVNPRVDTSVSPVRILADKLPGGQTWSTTFTIRNP